MFGGIGLEEGLRDFSPQRLRDTEWMHPAKTPSCQDAQSFSGPQISLISADKLTHAVAQWRGGSWIGHLCLQLKCFPYLHSKHMNRIYSDTAPVVG